MFKRIVSAIILILLLASPSFAQSDFRCPNCRVHVEFRAKRCWLCGYDLSEYWKKLDRDTRHILMAYATINQTIVFPTINKEKAKKAELNSAYHSQANSVINDIVDAFEKSFIEIEESLPRYYESCDISILDKVRGQFNNVISGLVSSVQNCSGMIDECDGDAFSRLNNLVDLSNTLRRKIESAKSYIPDQLPYGEFLIVKSGQLHKLSLPRNFSSSRLVIPAICRFNYVDVPISGLLEGTDLSIYPNLERIEYEGNLSVFDASLHNSCPNLKTVVFSGKEPFPPKITGGKVRESITFHVPKDAIGAYTSGEYEGWDNAMLKAEGERSDLYAKFGIVYQYDKSSREAIVQHYVKRGGDAPVFLETVAGVPITAIGDNAFAESGMKSIEIPSSVTRIGDKAFYKCTGLEKVVIPKNVTKIGQGAFLECRRLKEVSLEGQLPPSAHIEMVPRDCWITVGSSMLEQFVSIYPYSNYRRVREYGNGQYRAYDGDQIYLINEADKSAKLEKVKDTGTLDLPEKVFDNQFELAGIGTHAFEGCGTLTSLSIPSSVKEIEPEAFFGAPNLTVVHSLGDVPPVCSKAIFEKKNACTVFVPTESLKLYKKQRGWKSAKKIQAADAQGTSRSGKTPTSSSAKSEVASATRTTGATLSGVSPVQAISKWATLLSDKGKQKSMSSLQVKGDHSETFNAASRNLEIIMEDPDILCIDGYKDKPGNRTEVHFKRLRSGRTTMFVIFNGEYYNRYSITVE